MQVESGKVEMGNPADAPEQTCAYSLYTGGFVEPGFERVTRQFLKNFRKGYQEDRAQFVAYVRGKKVVDLWASRVASGEGRWGAAKDETYGPDNIHNVWSSSKVITSLCVAMLVDRGHIRSYDQKVSELWPEYAQNGKQDTTVAMVMRHESGLAVFSRDLDALDLTTENIKKGKISAIIEQETPSHTPGARREYHTITRGWIINEIVRRADPKGRTVGEFVRDEIAGKVGIQDELCFGLPEKLHRKVTPLCKRTNSWTFRHLLLPRPLGGGKIVGTSAPMRLGTAIVWPFLNLSWKLGFGSSIGVVPSKDTRPGRGLSKAIKFFNSGNVRKAEIPSANLHASARALALVANAVVQAGNTDLLSEEGKRRAHGNQNEMMMYFGSIVQPQTFCNAGWCFFKDERDDFVGWQGIGGSACQWHLGEQIAIGYSMNAMELNTWNKRAEILQHIVLECVREKKRKEKQSQNQSQWHLTLL